MIMDWVVHPSPLDQRRPLGVAQKDKKKKKNYFQMIQQNNVR